MEFIAFKLLRVLAHDAELAPPACCFAWQSDQHKLLLCSGSRAQIYLDSVNHNLALLEECGLVCRSVAVVGHWIGLGGDVVALAGSPILA